FGTKPSGRALAGIALSDRKAGIQRAPAAPPSFTPKAAPYTGIQGDTLCKLLWIPDRRGACHRAALCADPLAASGMTWQAEGTPVTLRPPRRCTRTASPDNAGRRISR